VAPSIAEQPTRQTVTVPTRRSSDLAATGTAPLTYQWKRNGTVIGGATGSSYTTPATTASDNGAQFAVAVSNSAGTVSSGAATLKVGGAEVGTPVTVQPGSQTATAGQ